MIDVVGGGMVGFAFLSLWSGCGGEGRGEHVYDMSLGRGELRWEVKEG